MINPFLILYGLVLVGFLIGVLAIVYHLVKFQLNKKVSIITVSLFLGGAGLLLLINLMIAFQIDWSQYSIVF